MIVDVHTHIPTHRDAVPDEDGHTDAVVGAALSLTGSLADFTAAMAPVDRAIVFGIACRPDVPEPPILDWRAGWPEGLNQNDIAAEVARSAPDRFVPFMSLHPEQPDVDDEYDRAVGDLGCRGMKFSLSYQVADPMSEAIHHLYQRLQDDGLPVMFHQGASASADARLMYAHPFVMDEVATLFPDLKIILAHMAHPWHTECVTVVRKHPNMWTDLSGLPNRQWVSWEAMRLFYEYGAMHKILLGSDWPLWDPQFTIDWIRGLGKFAADHHLPGIPGAELEAIINRDSLDILGLD